MSSIMEYAFGLHVLIVGVEDDKEDPSLLRVYIGARYNNTYVLVQDPDDQERMRRAWANPGGHLTMPRPPDDAIYIDDGRDNEETAP